MMLKAHQIIFLICIGVANVFRPKDSRMRGECL
jgi:hypothetical protein